MTAISGAEASYRLNAKGDPLTIFSQPDRAKYNDLACSGYLSFGAWQIFLGVHTQLVRNESGLSGPCALADWLYNAENNAQIARAIYVSQGYKAWSCYVNGAYEQHLTDARAACETATFEQLPRGSKLITAVSLAPPHIHLDWQDGTFTELSLESIQTFGAWIRFNVRPFELGTSPQPPLLQ